ncbi:MAG: YcxB family protein [Anaerostipes hadrus]
MKFHTQLKAKDIFKFSLAYTYSGVQAILTIFMLGVGAYMIVHGIGQPEGQTNIIFGVVVIALFVVINPLMIYVKAKKQAIENPVYKNPTYYTVRDDGIFVELGEESATIEWNRVYKITHFMGLTLLWQENTGFVDYELGDREKMLYEKEHQFKRLFRQTWRDISKYSKASTETSRKRQVEKKPD